MKVRENKIRIIIDTCIIIVILLLGYFTYDLNSKLRDVMETFQTYLNTDPNKIIIANQWAIQGGQEEIKEMISDIKPLEEMTIKREDLEELRTYKSEGENE